MRTKYAPPQMPFVEALFKGGKQKPTAIILKPSFTTSEEGAALAVAQYWNKHASFWDSGHYSVDDARRYRCVPDKIVAGKNDDDKGAIRIAMCADPVSGEVFWNEDVHRQILRRTAELVAELTLTYKIRALYLNDVEEERWRKHPTRRSGGIIINTSSGWPYSSFLTEVHAQQVLHTHI